MQRGCERRHRGQSGTGRQHAASEAAEGIRTQPTRVTNESAAVLMCSTLAIRARSGLDPQKADTKLASK